MSYPNADLRDTSVRKDAATAIKTNTYFGHYARIGLLLAMLLAAVGALPVL